MKRSISVFAILLCIFNLLSIPAMAANSEANHTILYDDGSYAIITSGENRTVRSSNYFCKTYTYYNSLGQKCFDYTLYAAFTYNGVTSRADFCDFTAKIYWQGWDIDTHSEYISGNTAYGNATFTGPDGVVRTVNLTLTCDKNGNVT